MFYYNDVDQTLGFYRPADKSLNMNVSSASVGEYLTLLHAATQTDDLSNNQLFKAFFLPALGRTPTLVHELEHARRGESHAHGAHTAGRDPEGELLAFDTCANNWMRYSLSNELLERWKTELLHCLKSNSLTGDQLLQLGNDIMTLEKHVNKKKSMEKLGF